MDLLTYFLNGVMHWSIIKNTETLTTASIACHGQEHGKAYVYKSFTFSYSYHVFCDFLIGI